jgi:hypothetical protein
MKTLGAFGQGASATRAGDLLGNSSHGHGRGTGSGHSAPLREACPVLTPLAIICYAFTALVTAMAVMDQFQFHPKLQLVAAMLLKSNKLDM